MPLKLNFENETEKIKNRAMAKKEKTIVDYIHQQLLLAFGDELKSLRGLFVIAKEVEEKQLKDAWNNGVLAKTFEKTFEQYYNEKYEK